MVRCIVPVLVATLSAGTPAGAAPADATDAGITDAATHLDATDGDATSDGLSAPDAGTVDAAPIPPAPAPAPSLRAWLTLRARIVEKGTRQPLEGASVSVDGTPAGETDAAGQIQVPVTPGPHHLQIQLPGHELVDRRVDVQPASAEELIRVPPRLTGERYETYVRAGHPELPPLPISADEARKVAGTSGDPLRVIGSLPGVAQVVWPAALYVVRGANPGNTGFFLDGVRVPALFHLALGPSIVHPYLVGGIDFYPGGYPASFAGYASGIVAARTAPPPTDRMHAAADVTAYDAGGIVTGPWDGGRGTVAAAARYSYTGALFSLLSSDTVLRYGDYQLRADHALGGGRATVLAFGSIDELGWVGRTYKQEYGSLQFHRVDARWRGGVAGGRLLAGFTMGVDRSRSTLFERPIQMRALSAAPRIGFERTFGAIDVEIGADANAQDFAAEVPDFQRRGSDLSRSRRAFTQGAYATATIHAGRRLTIAPGVRGDLFAEQGTRRLAAEPRVAVAYQLTPAVALVANGGGLAQMPSLPVSVPGFEAFGLADLGLQTSWGGSLGVEARLPRSLTLGVTGYYQRVRLTDVRDIDLANLDPGGPDFLVSRLGRTYGVELLVRRADQGRVFGWLAYTLSRSLREDDGGVLGRSDWDQRHILNLVAGWRLGGGYALGARFHYNTGRYAPVVGGGGIHRELPAFYDLDLRAERRFVFDRFVLDAYVDLGNVTLTRQVVQLSATVDPDGRTVVSEQAFRIVLPTIGAHGEF